MTKQLYVIGDIHGRLDLLKQSLEIAGIIDKTSNWIKKDTVLVQLGDIIDRGPHSLKNILFLAKLAKQAQQYNSSVEVMLGNHELMAIFAGMGNNYAKFHWFFNGGDWVYKEWSDKKNCQSPVPEIFYNEFSPERSYGQIISQYKVAFKHSGNLFVHGGIIGENRSIRQLNKILHQTFANKSKHLYEKDIFSRTGPFWIRNFSEQALAEQCEEYDVKRQIVGHTPKMGLEISQNGKLVYADLGMNQNQMPFIIEIDNSHIKLKINNDQKKLPLGEDGIMKVVSKEKNYPFTKPKYDIGDLIDLFITEDGDFNVQLKILNIIKDEKIIWYAGEFIFNDNGKRFVKVGKWPIGHVDKHGIKLS
ncbi:metallophosphoesterase [Proteinivorax tanatarense]|uniref:Metallophosphoesterase n=1 Tax=Proteinivorax tanatarense TaxID=1260629 RepID=A0AAU7VIV1_9FIRM